MGDAIGQALPFAVGIALSPIPIVAVVLMLGSPRARVDGPAFIVGWLVGLALVGVVVLALAAPADATEGGQPATWVSWLKLALGLVLLLVAARQWRGRPTGGDDPPLPAWMGAIDSFSPARSAGTGFVVAAVNPKNLLLAVGGAVAIAQTETSGADQALAYAVFALVATIGVAVPVVMYFALGDRSAAMLDSLKTWMGRNNAVIMAVLCLIIGVKLIGDAISGFSG